MNILNSKNKSSTIFNQRILILVIMIGVLVFFVSLGAPQFISERTFTNLVNNMSILAIVALGQMIVMITAGIDISVGTAMGLVAMSVGLILIEYPDLHPALAILIGMILGTIMGFINGVLVVKGKIVALIATLATMNIFRGINVLINNLYYEGQYIGANKLSAEFKAITKVEIIGLPVMLYYVLFLYIVFYFILHHSRFGRQIYAVGSNLEAAKTIGINTNKILIATYSLCGLMFGIAGVLYLSLYTSAQTDTGLGFEFIAITAVIIGGVSVFGGSGILWAVLLGTLFMTIITDSLNILRISPFWKMAINGFMLLSAILINHYLEARKKNK